MIILRTTINRSFVSRRHPFLDQELSGNTAGLFSSSLGMRVIEVNGIRIKTMVYKSLSSDDGLALSTPNSHSDSSLYSSNRGTQ